MFIRWILFFVISINLYFLDYGIFLEWIVLSLNSLNIEILILIDWVSLLFIRFIFLISSIVLIYRYIYIMGDKFLKRFIYLVVLFIFSIIFMIIRPNVIRILIGWDGLGLVSYCLVIYYQNYVSYTSGIVTIICNRIGDVGLLIGISLLIIRGRWNIWIVDKTIEILILFLAAITKRAQIPFSVWLPKAIAAPTPVSALVHSSTLVTAGVYLIIRFNNILIKSRVCYILLYLSVLTMFIAGLIANVENDLKKIIALSTLSQLGLIIIILRLGWKIISFYHLLTHAIFKSILFICAGIIIHSLFNNQDIRLFGNLNLNIPFTIIRFLIARLALCGFPFLAGFYSKDFIIELIYRLQINIFILFMIVISLIFTVIYSIRLYYYIYFNKIKFYRYFRISENRLISISIIILIFFRVSIGGLLNWLFFFDYYLLYLNLRVKLITLVICIIGILIGIILRVINFLKKIYYLNFFIRSIWFLDYLYFWFYNPFNIGGVKVYLIDKIWIEYIFKDIFKYLIKIFRLMVEYKIYIFIQIFIWIFIFIYLIY